MEFLGAVEMGSEEKRKYFLNKVIIARSTHVRRRAKKQSGNARDQPFTLMEFFLSELSNDIGRRNCRQSKWLAVTWIS